MKNLKIVIKKNIINGFTLIELLVVISVFIVLSSLVLSILITVLRGAKSSDSIIAIKQNGEQASSQIVKSLRFAQSLEFPNLAGTGGSEPECSSSGISVPEVRATLVNLSTVEVKCPGSFTGPNFITLNGNALTNKDTVVVKSCYFVCTQNANSSPVISINFSLSKINLSGLQEEDSIEQFHTSVELRNLGN